MVICAEITLKYYDLSIGIYSKNGYTVQVIKSDDYLNTPTRVNKETGIVEIQNNLVMPKLSFFFYLLWGFIKFKKNENDLDVDIKGIKIIDIITEGNYDQKSFIDNYISTLGKSLTKSNLLRINKFLEVNS